MSLTAEREPTQVPTLVRDTVAPPFDLDRVRADFPILAEEIHGHPLVYLDSAASAQKPQAVIAAITACLASGYANIHRGVHSLSQRATDTYEGARTRVQRFLNAPSADEVIFVRGTTEAINLVAESYGRPRLGPGDEVLITELEHHSNLVPWQRLCAATGATLRVAPIDDRGVVIPEEYARRLSPQTRIVALAHVSNALGTILPVREMADLAHAAGAPGTPGIRGRSWWSTALSRRPICRSTSRRSAATSSPSPATRSAGRAASASSGGAPRCSPKCPPGSRAAG